MSSPVFVSGFHVYVYSKLKSYFSVKKVIVYQAYVQQAIANGSYIVQLEKRQYTQCKNITNINLKGDILAGKVIPHRALALEDYGKIPLVTIGDPLFPKHQWLLKGYIEAGI